jgi:hypothetical protein
MVITAPLNSITQRWQAAQSSNFVMRWQQIFATAVTLALLLPVPAFGVITWLGGPGTSYPPASNWTLGPDAPYVGGTTNDGNNNVSATWTKTPSTATNPNTLTFIAGPSVPLGLNTVPLYIELQNKIQLNAGDTLSGNSTYFNYTPYPAKDIFSVTFSNFSSNWVGSTQPPSPQPSGVASRDPPDNNMFDFSSTNMTHGFWQFTPSPVQSTDGKPVTAVVTVTFTISSYEGGGPGWYNQSNNSSPASLTNLIFGP